MTQLTLNGKSLLLVPVPGTTTDVGFMFGDTLAASYIDENGKSKNKWLVDADGWIAENWAGCKVELIGKDPLNLTEEEAREIVEIEPCDIALFFKDYERVWGYFRKATTSLSSLLRANQMEKAIFLINKSKQNAKRV